MQHQVFNQLQKLLIEALDVREESVSRESLLVDDLGADSLDLVQLALDVEERFGIEVQERDIVSLQTVGDVATYIRTRMEEAS